MSLNLYTHQWYGNIAELCNLVQMCCRQGGSVSNTSQLFWCDFKKNKILNWLKEMIPIYFKNVFSWTTRPGVQWSVLIYILLIYTSDVNTTPVESF